MLIRWIVCFGCMLLLAGCEEMAVHMTPKKHAIASSSPLAKHAQELFWETLHRGQYNNISQSQYQLMAAYLENPNDPNLAAHLGFLHIWSITERQRFKTIPPTIVDHIVLSKFYFSNAVELNNQDARYLGFYGDSTLVEGKIFHNEREQVSGYFILKQAINMWPEFNYFTAGYVMSVLPPDTKQYKEAVEWQWKTLDLCAGEKVDRRHPDFSPYMKNATSVGPKRVCWNSWIAPYNFEGFFMNMGDMLVKAGDWQMAQQVYRNAKLDSAYSTWPYRQMLEDRIINAKNNVASFQKEYVSPNKTIMFNSGYGCVACHQSR
jgi:hypothetical protein